ncbi:hypothetical protein CAOG_003346 [Capsaspora owczarzaki ATCC 30864]|uniref:CHCH domain-containing protein n=1 Tax=Capsaspora owczarzaki (strain ATCC 30864) TaxID=595528 RepID=A0A0D2WP49_CAPO3|nr:hypothetical protein CAOG_003346 [Capsaspora owczarzaki ATCC 30864]
MSQPAKGPKPRPPEKGSFPLDHEGECKDAMRRFMACMRENKQNSSACRIESRDYLNDLMTREDLKQLGFRDLDDAAGKPNDSRPPPR